MVQEQAEVVGQSHAITSVQSIARIKYGKWRPSKNSTPCRLHIYVSNVTDLSTAVVHEVVATGPRTCMIVTKGNKQHELFLSQ